MSIGLAVATKSKPFSEVAAAALFFVFDFRVDRALLCFVGHMYNMCRCEVQGRECMGGRSSGSSKGDSVRAEELSVREGNVRRVLGASFRRDWTKFRNTKYYRNY